MNRELLKRPLKGLRSLIFILKRNLIGFGPPGDPGLDEAAKECFLQCLERSNCYLEFGAGGTTLAADRAGVPTLSVEGDHFFARAVRSALAPGSKVQVLAIDLGLTKEWSAPVFVRPTPKRLSQWRRYVDAPFEELSKSGQFPDFVFVDGRFRQACVLRTVRAAERTGRPVTIMVDDYFTTGREHYHDVEQWLGRPKQIGRAAIFEVMSGGIPAVPTDDDLMAAVADYR